MAFRNLLRNRARTSISMATVGLTTAVLIFANALTAGMSKQVVGNVVNLGVGEAQVHHATYLANPSLSAPIDDPERVLAGARGAGLAAAPRALGAALLSGESQSAGARVWGVDPVSERQIGDLPSRIEAGEFIGPEPQMGIVLGQRLARGLRADLGSEVAMIVQDAEGSVGTGLFRVRGILASVGASIDRGAAIVHRADFANVFAVPAGRVYEIAVSSRGDLPVERVVALLEPTAIGLDVRGWRELQPAVASIIDIWKVSTLALSAIFLFAAALGVVNALLLAWFERIREFGIVRALGTSGRRLIADVMVEVLLLAGVSAALGMSLGAAMSFLAERYGLDMAGLGGRLAFSGISLDHAWRAELTTAGVVLPALCMVIVAMLAAAYPAVKATRLKVTDALNHV